MSKVICPYCGFEAEQATGADIYTGRDDLKDKKFLVCWPCDARVGCHKKSGEPFGTLANKQLRLARMEVHKLFDPLWKTDIVGDIKRGELYTWLAGQLEIPEEECHIGMFNLKRCNKALAACSARYMRKGIVDETGNCTRKS